MHHTLKRTWRAIQANSLWIVSIGLMLASSGVDGEYMTYWMPASAPWLGYILNTTGDVASEVLMYWFGRLQQASKNTKRHRFSWWLLPAELVTVAYSWFFSWRQLRRVMISVEGSATVWVAPISAAFVPVLLAAIGYAQALMAGKFAQERHRESASENSKSEESSTLTSGNGKVALATMSKKDRILYLAKRKPDLSQANIALEADCSEGYVSKVLSSEESEQEEV